MDPVSQIIFGWTYDFTIAVSVVFAVQLVIWGAAALFFRALRWPLWRRWSFFVALPFGLLNGDVAHSLSSQTLYGLSMHQTGEVTALTGLLLTPAWTGHLDTVRWTGTNNPPYKEPTCKYVSISGPEINMISGRNLTWEECQEVPEVWQLEQDRALHSGHWTGPSRGLVDDVAARILAKESLTGVEPTGKEKAFIEAWVVDQYMPDCGFLCLIEVWAEKDPLVEAERLPELLRLMGAPEHATLVEHALVLLASIREEESVRWAPATETELAHLDEQYEALRPTLDDLLEAFASQHAEQLGRIQ